MDETSGSTKANHRTDARWQRTTHSDSNMLHLLRCLRKVSAQTLLQSLPKHIITHCITFH
jgi:hemin uptake protein HemP